MKVIHIIFGDPITPIAIATRGTLEDELITIGRSGVTVMEGREAELTSGQMIVQWSNEDGRPQKQVSRYVEIGDHVVAIYLDDTHG